MNKETAANLSMYRVFFRAALKRTQEWFAEYEADVADWYATGDGASPEWVDAATQPWFDIENDDPSRQVNIGGRGYAFPNCIHGMSRWTDYDNICGGCEDGLTAIQVAQGEARRSFRQYTERLDWLNAAPEGMSRELRSDICTWVFSGVRL